VSGRLIGNRRADVETFVLEAKHAPLDHLGVAKRRVYTQARVDDADIAIELREFSEEAGEASSTTSGGASLKGALG
jgi:hypothetical protein